VLVIAFWIRGQFKADWFQWHKTDPHANTWRAADMVSGRSGFYFSWQAFVFERPGHAQEYASQLNRINGLAHANADPQSMPYHSSFWNHLGFASRGDGMQTATSGTRDNPSNMRYTFDRCHIPYWFLLLTFGCGGLPFVLRLRSRLRRRKRLRENRCLACGYDLRGSSQRCPECGEPAGESAPGTRK